jgi:Family of unknown function (DUF6134)
MTNLKPAMALGFCIISASGVVAAAAAADPPAGSWHFTVLLDGKRIGEHDFTVARHGDETDVDTEAHFKVKAAFIAFYQYDHRDHEVWRNGCLAGITSRTHDNGRSFAVEGELKGGTFEVQGSGGAATLPACVKTFAYWDQSFLTEPQLLNSQTGKFQAVTLTRVGPQSVKVGGRSIPAQRYSLRAPKLDIDLWYSESGRWLALQSKLESGRLLRYEIQ